MCLSDFFSFWDVSSGLYGDIWVLRIAVDAWLQMPFVFSEIVKYVTSCNNLDPGWLQDLFGIHDWAMFPPVRGDVTFVTSRLTGGDLTQLKTTNLDSLP